MSHTAVGRISSVLSGRRFVLLLGLIVIVFAVASIGRVEGASADTNSGGDGITIDCSLGNGEFAEPGTMITLPAAGDLPPLTVVCGEDGHWHAVVAVVRPPSTVANPIQSSGLRAL
jgi:hypothetical protein